MTDRWEISRDWENNQLQDMRATLTLLFLSRFAFVFDYNPVGVVIKF